MGSTQYEALSTREGFNLSLRHFKQVMEIVGDLEDNINLADQVNDLLAEKAVAAEQIQPIVNALLIDRYGYASTSYNLHENVDTFDSVLAEAKKWTAVDIVVAYYSPELGLSLINPKNDEHWSAVQSLKKTEFVTVYCGAFSKTDGNGAYSKVLSTFVDLLEGRKIKTPAGVTGGKFKAPGKKKPVVAAPVKRRQAPKQFAAAGRAAAAEAPAAAPAAPAPAPAGSAAAPPSGKVRMTPLYGVVVTNELFHNGNVEAWKKIIQSYELSHAGLTVNVYYEGEKIHDINTLFKWGKVKRGTPIMISVQGVEIGDVAKLQRYLRQGASHLFEVFLKGAPGQILNLF